MKTVYSAGRFLSKMVFQNISGLIAFGLLRVLFGPKGWLPHPEIYKMAGMIFTYFIPFLFAYTGGKMIGGQRGGVIAAFVVVGMITENPSNYVMILPAMAIGPAVGYVINKLDKWLENRIPSGFELLYYNVAAGLVGILFTILCAFYISPLFIRGLGILFRGTEFLVESSFLPIVALVIEPGKVLFFNNPINHGILEPLGINQAKQAGQSILFLLETNPGPGFGLLLAYLFFNKETEKGTVKSSLAIHVIGGIHEVYFPYALMNPLTIIPLILGGATGDFIFSYLKAGLLSTPSPGSILTLLMMAPKGMHLPVFMGFLGSALVSFLGSALVLSRAKKKTPIGAIKGEYSIVTDPAQTNETSPVRKIIFACDAGMGSSAMGAAALRKKLKQANLDITVVHCSVEDIPSDADMVVVLERLEARAKAAAAHAEMFCVPSFVDSAFYDELTERLKAASPRTEHIQLPESDSRSTSITADHILLKQDVADKWEAIQQAGELLVKLNHVEPRYLEEMKQREQLFSTYLANGIAIPHGINSDSPNIKKGGIVIMQVPKGVDFGDGNIAYLIIAIAGPGNEQLSILSALAVLVECDEKVQTMIHTDNKEDIVQIVKKTIFNSP